MAETVDKLERDDIRSPSYTANTLNQITQRDVPGYVNIVGAASATATNVNVNNNHAYRKGEYYRVELPTNNGSAAVWLGVTNRVVQNGTTNTVTGNVFLPQTPEVFSHDADGNLTNDGHWAYVWDAENRLTRMVAPTAIPTGARYALNFTNDWRGRRTSKVVSNWTGSAWSKSYEHKFVYDGWNLVATLDSANTLLYSFQWGTDLSGTMQGAGGVGGLVSMTVHSGASAGTYFYAYDGNGNVAALINAADGTIAARYEYGPFGELIRATGPLAFLNPFRFSTKFQDDETGFLYYGYRYYDPSAGRWPSRDPIGEEGGVNLYGFVNDDPINRFDLLGLAGLVISRVAGPYSLDNCGAAKSVVQFRLSWLHEAAPNGWIIQHVKFTANVTDCKGKKVKPFNLDGYEYWEAWQVVNGQVYGGRKDGSGGNFHQGDTFQTATEGGNRKGTITITGKVKFVEGYNLTEPPWGRIKYAGSLPAISKLNDWNESDASDHIMQVQFNCCCDKPWDRWGIIKVNETQTVTGTP